MRRRLLLMLCACGDRGGSSGEFRSDGPGANPPVDCLADCAPRDLACLSVCHTDQSQGLCTAGTGTIEGTVHYNGAVMLDGSLLVGLLVGPEVEDDPPLSLRDAAASLPRPFSFPDAAACVPFWLIAFYDAGNDSAPTAPGPGDLLTTSDDAFSVDRAGDIARGLNVELR